MAIRRTEFTVEVLFETNTATQREHQKLERYAYRNILGANQDLPDSFSICIVRDGEGQLLEFSGSGRGTPSEDLLAELTKLTLEKRKK